MTVSEKVQSKVPQLRFPEFDGEWEENNLGSVSKNVMYGAGAAATEYDGTNGYIRITDIDDESRDFLDVKISSPEGEWDDKYILKEGDLVFARTGASTGKCYKYKKPDGRLFFAGFLIKAGLDESYIDFVYQNTFRTSYWRWISVMSVRSGQPGINAEELKSYKFNAPKEVERKKISRLLINVDKKISLLKQKHEQLVLYKKGIMQQLFSQQLRFKDDNGQDFPDWEKNRLDYFLERTSDAVEVDKTTKYRQIGIRSHGKGIFHKDSVSGEELGDKRVFWVHTKALVLNIVFAWEHAVAVTSDSESGMIASHRFPMYVPKNNRADLDFMGIFFLRPRGKYLLGIASPGGAGRNKTLGQSNFSELKVTLPCLDEQNKIASFVKSIDQKINLAKQKIEQTQAYKQGLLQQMFV